MYCTRENFVFRKLYGRSVQGTTCPIFRGIAPTDSMAGRATAVGRWVKTGTDSVAKQDGLRFECSAAKAASPCSISDAQSVGAHLAASAITLSQAVNAIGPTGVTNESMGLAYLIRVARHDGHAFMIRAPVLRVQTIGARDTVYAALRGRIAHAQCTTTRVDTGPCIIRNLRIPRIDRGSRIRRVYAGRTTTCTTTRSATVRGSAGTISSRSPTRVATDVSKPEPQHDNCRCRYPTGSAHLKISLDNRPYTAMSGIWARVRRKELTGRPRDVNAQVPALVPRSKPLAGLPFTQGRDINATPGLRAVSYFAGHASLGPRQPQASPALRPSGADSEPCSWLLAGPSHQSIDGPFR